MREILIKEIDCIKQDWSLIFLESEVRRKLNIYFKIIVNYVHFAKKNDQK